ncbi:MAG: zinc ribbon domain-containing protein [Candidatus Bathyarchaeia archaeon]
MRQLAGQGKSRFWAASFREGSQTDQNRRFLSATDKWVKAPPLTIPGGLVTLHCPSCGREVSEDGNYCMHCGAKLMKTKEIAAPPQTYGYETPPFSAVREVVVKRFEGLRMKDACVIANCVDSESYTKFDDWPPFRRQRNEALKSEAEALKVLSDYRYRIEDLAIDVFDGAALATFHLSYGGQIRKRPFEIRSRVTVVLRNAGDGWKIIHEHYSRFPTQ